MKTIVIPVEEDKGLDSAISSHFGNGKHYLLIGVDGSEVTSVETRRAPTGDCSRWSCKAKDFLRHLDCDVLIAPRIGTKARGILAESYVEIAGSAGKNAREALKAYLGKDVTTSTVNTYCPHSSQGMFTAAAHAGGVDATTGSVVPPIYQTSTFTFANAAEGAARFSGEGDGYVYTRMGNPTIRALEDCVANLEGGYAGLATSTGMAAIVSVFMALLGKELDLVGTDSVYGPSRVVVERDFARFGVTSSFVDTSNLQKIRESMVPSTRLLFIETPANPTLKLTDIEGCARIAHEHGALLVVDNTFMSPYLQRPFELGADIVIHSMTKFLNGHSDVVAGMVVSRTQELHEKIQKTLVYHGGTMDPHQAYLVTRGVKTLPLRMEKSQSNALRMARFLEAHPKIE